MYLVLHGLFLQVIVSIVQFQHGSTLCSAGEPGYLDFDNLPETNFSCQGKVIGGYYADVEAGCQMFHVCTIGQKDEIMDIKFLCLNGTVFDQETRVCERVDEVDCSKSERFYNLNLELYGNNAVTLSLHDISTDDEDEPTDLIDESHESQRTTSSRPSTTTTTTTTTQRPIISSTTAASGSYQHPNGYPQHYQPQPRFPSVQTSQSKSLYDDKNGGYHHQYIYHTGDHRNNNLDNNNNGNNNNNNQNHNSNNNNNNNPNNNNNNNNQATSYQLFSNQGVGSTTGNPQIHQIRYSSTPGPQIQIRNDHQPTVSPIFHATSSTIQTLLNSNANSPALINPIFHSHGIASTTEQFAVHNNNPRETDEYPDNAEDESDDDIDDERRPLQAIEPTTQGKVSKLKISPISVQQESSRTVQQSKEIEITSEQQRITSSFLPTPNNNAEAVRSFYPTPRTSTKSSSSHVTQHIHIPPPPSIPQLKPHQVTINLTPHDIQRIVQNPSPLLPSQSRVIVTAKASVSDESGRSLNTTQLVTLPLPTIPASYDDYKEGDESFDPFYRDVPKIRNDRRVGGRFRWPIRELRKKRSARIKRDLASDENEKTKTDEKFEIPLENRTEKVVKIDSIGKVYGIEGFKGPSVSDAILPQVVEVLRAMSSGNQMETVIEENTDVKDTVKTKEIDDGKIFDDTESQNSKEVDTRAVVDDSEYSKNRNNRFDNDEKKLKNKHSKGHESSEKVADEESLRFSLELPEVIDSTKSKSRHFSKMLKFKEDVPEEEDEMRNDEADVDDKELDRATEISGEENFDNDYYYDGSMDTSGVRSSEEDSVEYSKNRKNNFDNDEKRWKNKSKGLESTGKFVDEESSRFHLKLPEVIDSTKSNGKHTSEVVKIEDNVTEEKEETRDEAYAEEKELDQATEVSGEENFDNDYYYDGEIDTSIARSSDEDFVKYSKGAPNKINSSRHHKSLGRERVFKDDDRSVDAETSRRRDKKTKLEARNYEDDYDFPDVTTVQSNEEVGSFEMSSEYADVEQSSHEDYREIQDDEEDISISQDYTTMSGETNSPDSQEVASTTEKNVSTKDSKHREHSDGVLKFTDEIPIADKIDEPEEPIKSISPEETPQDYIDDNYEPQSYREKEEYSSTTETGITEIFEELTTIQTENEKHEEEEMNTTETTSVTEMLENIENKKEEKQNDEPQLDKMSGDEDQMEKSMKEPIILEQITSTSTTTTTSMTTTVSTATTSTTTPTTTTTKKITTPRPTPPKLFKPFTLRKNYVYVPPSTTPVPVIIKPRLALLNPKPAKPLKSYNDYAPKPIIRKSPLFARKISTTHRTTTPPSEDFEISTIIPVIPTKNPNIEENTSKTWITQVPTTKISESSTAIISTTMVDENLRIEANNVHASTMQIIETLPTIESQTFTPYPLLKMTESSLTIDKILGNNDETGREEITTSMPDVDNNNIPSVIESGIVSTTMETLTEIKSTKLSSQRSTITSTEKPQQHEILQIEPTSDSTILQNNVAINEQKSYIPIFATIGQAPGETTTENPFIATTRKDSIINQAPTLASRKLGTIKRIASFNCLERDMYRFYADGRDCRLFHYCSPGFTSRQVLDFRFVCEEGTSFDEESQSCIHDVKNPKCRKRVW